MSDFLPAFLLRSLRDPRSVVSEVINRDWQMPLLWQGLLLASCLGSLIQILPQILVAGIGAATMFGLGPFALCVLLGLGTFGLAGIITQIGRLLGGQGAFPGLFALFIWFQAMGIALQAAVLFVMFALPALGAVLAVAGNVYLIYVLVVFVDEAHQMKSIGASIASVVLSFLILAFAMAMVAALVGVQPTVEFGNV